MHPLFANMSMQDAQQAALSFLTQQLTIVEPTVYNIQYPDIQYPELVPVDTSGNEWAKSVTFFSQDMTGKADWFHANAKDIPLADITREKFEQGIEMAAIGYRYNLDELATAMQLGIPLTNDKAAAARRAYEEFVDDVAIRGRADKGWTGLINASGVTVITLTADGTGSTPYWANKTETQILRDFNSILTGMYLATNRLELADTVLLPDAVLIYLAQTRMSNIEAFVDPKVQRLHAADRSTAHDPRGAWSGVGRLGWRWSDGRVSSRPAGDQVPPADAPSVLPGVADGTAGVRRAGHLPPRWCRSSASGCDPLRGRCVGGAVRSRRQTTRPHFSERRTKDDVYHRKSVEEPASVHRPAQACRHRWCQYESRS
jgi:hypothetical protein